MPYFFYIKQLSNLGLKMLQSNHFPAAGAALAKYFHFHCEIFNRK